MIGNLLRAALLLFVLAGTACTGAIAQTLALVGGSVYVSPDAVPLDDAVVVTSNGAITAVGRAGEVAIPPEARVIDCTGKTIVAGFWNSHVHFTEAAWKNAASAPAASLTSHMQEMLTRWGFTTVWDVGSHPDDSLPLRHRVDAGEVPGPTSILPATSFRRTVIPPICRPNCNSPKPRRPTRPRSDARLSADWDWTA